MIHVILTYYLILVTEDLNSSDNVAEVEPFHFVKVEDATRDYLFYLIFLSTLNLNQMYIAL